MNSRMSDGLLLSNDQLANELTSCLEDIFSNTEKVTVSHKALLETNLSVIAYIEESKRRLAELRLKRAREASSLKEVVKILSKIVAHESEEYRKVKEGTMSSPVTPRKRQTRPKVIEDNNNTNNKFSECQQARTFILWYKKMIDHNRQNLGLYLSDDATLEWFGKTIKTRKKVTTFLRYDMQCTRHDFTTVESIERIQTKEERLQRKDDTIVASPLHSPELISLKTSRAGKRRLRSNCNSPEWAEGCQPEIDIIEKKKPKFENCVNLKSEHNELKRSYNEDGLENAQKGDGLNQRIKRKCIPVTPPNKEIGQGDCLPSTSGTDFDRSHDALNAQLPKLAVQCEGYIEFTRTRNSRSVDAMKWERKCKVQISYSEDPLNVGEYIIWALRYMDESKCRRNLLAAFDEIAKEVNV